MVHHQNKLAVFFLAVKIRCHPVKLYKLEDLGATIREGALVRSGTYLVFHYV